MHLHNVLSFSQTTNSDSSKLKVFADDNVKLDKNGRKFSKQVENNVEKGEIVTRRQILDSSKLKEFADDNFNFDKNSRKLSKRVKNTVGKRVFKRLVSQGRQKVSLCGNGLGTISPFPAVFKSLVSQTCKNQDLAGKGYTM